MSNGDGLHGTPASVEEVQKVLESFGFRKLRVPYRIGTVEFDFGSPMATGDGHHELILVVAVDRIDLSEIVWNVQNIARALDVAGSSRSITAVLVGEVGLNESATHRLQSVARVLRVGSGDANDSAIERSLAPILPLRLDLSVAMDTEAPLRKIEKYAQAGADSARLKTLIARSHIDAAQVEAELLTWIEQAFTLMEPHENSA